MQYVPADFARELERELAALRDRIAAQSNTEGENDARASALKHAAADSGVGVLPAAGTVVTVGRDPQTISGAETSQAAVPEGWKLVPKIATDEMRRVVEHHATTRPYIYVQELWDAMLAAAPAAPSAGELERISYRIGYVDGANKLTPQVPLTAGERLSIPPSPTPDDKRDAKG